MSHPRISGLYRVNAIGLISTTAAAVLSVVSEPIDLVAGRLVTGAVIKYAVSLHFHTGWSPYGGAQNNAIFLHLRRRFHQPQLLLQDHMKERLLTVDLWVMRLSAVVSRDVSGLISAGHADHG